MRKTLFIMLCVAVCGCGKRPATAPQPPASARTPKSEEPSPGIPAADVVELARQLGDDDPRVRFSAAEALCRMGPKCAPALPQLIEHIDDEEWAHFENPRRGGEVRAMVDRAIAQIEEGVVPRLIACLDSPKPARRRNAALILGTRKDPVAIKPMIALLSDEDRLVRARTAEALGNLGYPDAAPAVAGALRDPDSFVRTRAAYALGGMRSVEVVPQLVAALGDQDEGVREYAALSLGLLGDASAVDVLASAAESDKSEHVRRAAVDAIRRIEKTEARQNKPIHSDKE